MRHIFEYDEEDFIVVEKKDFESMNLAQFANEYVIDLCEKEEGNIRYSIFEDDCHILKTERNQCQVLLSQIERRKFWDAPIGLDVYMEWKKQRIEELKGEGIPIQLDDFDDDGDYIHLNYSIELNTWSGAEILKELTRIIEINIVDALQVKMDKVLGFSQSLNNRTII